MKVKLCFISTKHYVSQPSYGYILGKMEEHRGENKGGRNGERLRKKQKQMATMKGETEPEDPREAREC